MREAIKILVLSSRPLSWVNTAFPFAMTYYVLGRQVDYFLVVASIFFLIPYNFLMYGINDVFDYESDRRNPRKGGIEGALLPPHLHRPMIVLSLSLAVPFLVVLGLWGSRFSNGVLALALFFVVAYSAKYLRLKEVPLLDSVVSSLHFVLPAIYAMTVFPFTLSPLALTALTAFFLWGMASHAFGAVQDLVADREAGLGSIATVLGAQGTVRFAIFMYLSAALVMLTTPWPLPIISSAATIYVCALLPWWRVQDGEAHRVNRSWKLFLIINFISGALVFLVALDWLRG